MSQTKSLATLTRMNQLTCLVPRLVTQRSMATQGDQEVTKFLQEEIQTEKKNARALPKLDGWSVALDGAEVTLTREGAGGEKVMVTLNVNHTVDSAEPDDGSEEVIYRKIFWMSLSILCCRHLKCCPGQILKLI